MTSVRAFIIVFHLFARMTKASGLTFKHFKCVLIPLAFELTAENVATLREWLRINIPAWCDIQICSKGKYLGLFLGPGVSPSTNWNGAACKFVDRVSQISDQRWPLEVRARQFASKAVSVLSYIAQLQDPPPKFKSLELRMASKALGLATPAFCTNSSIRLANSEDLNSLGQERLCMLRGYVLHSRPFMNSLTSIGISFMNSWMRLVCTT